MKSALDANVLPQLDNLLAKYEKLMKGSRTFDHSDIGEDEASEFVAASMAAICRTASTNSQYAIQATQAIEEISTIYGGKRVPIVGGILRALRNDVQAGYLDSLEEIIHADVFTDFLEMSQYLLEEGYKDPAAVIIGGVLEEHLRKLCTKNGIPTDTPDSKGALKPKKVETMNTDLAAANVYSKGDQKNVTAWYDLRTKAAHGHYNEYTKPQIELLLQSVRDFITRNPA